MITFEEWMEKNHLELINEIKFSDMAKKLTLATAAISGIGGTHAAEPVNKPNPVAVSKYEHQFEKATTLRQIYEIAKKDHDNGQRSDVAFFARQLRNIAPEYYNPGSEYAVTVQDLAGMPDDAYSEFLLNLKNNYEEQEKMQRMPITKWTDQDGTTEVEARFLKFDSNGDPQGLNGWVWLQKKDGKKVRLPFRWLSSQNQQQVKNTYKLSLGTR